MSTLVVIFLGMPCGYGLVKALTDTSVRNCKGDVSAFRPSIMVGIPAVWESIRKVIVAKRQLVESSHESHFNGAMYIPSLFLRLLLSSVRATTGGRLHCLLHCMRALLLAVIPRNYCAGHRYTRFCDPFNFR